MSVTCELAWNEGSASEGDGGSRVRRYVLTGTNDPEEAIEALMAATTAPVGGLAPGAWELGDRLSENAWFGIVQYGMIEVTGVKREPQQPVDSVESYPVGDPLETEGEFAMDIGTGKRRAMHSLLTVGSFATPSEPVTGEGYTQFADNSPNYGTMLNVNGNGEPQGEDVEIEVINFSITRTLDALPTGYLRKLMTYRKSVNSEDLTVTVDGQDFELLAGELFYRGAQISYRRSNDSWTVVLHFGVQFNEIDYPIGGPDNSDTIKVDKRGWDYLWVRDERKERTIGGVKQFVRLPIWAYTEQMYKYKDLREIIL